MKSRAGMKNKSLTDFHLFILLSFFFFLHCDMSCQHHQPPMEPSRYLIHSSWCDAEFHDPLAPGSGGCAIVCGPRPGLPDMCPGLCGMACCRCHLLSCLNHLKELTLSSKRVSIWVINYKATQKSFHVTVLWRPDIFYPWIDHLSTSTPGIMGSRRDRLPSSLIHSTLGTELCYMYQVPGYSKRKKKKKEMVSALKDLTI